MKWWPPLRKPDHRVNLPKKSVKVKAARAGVKGTGAIGTKALVLETGATFKRRVRFKAAMFWNPTRPANIQKGVRMNHLSFYHLYVII